LLLVLLGATFDVGVEGRLCLGVVARLPSLSISTSVLPGICEKRENDREMKVEDRCEQRDKQ
jgi:hypothetical protein